MYEPTTYQTNPASHWCICANPGLLLKTPLAPTQAHAIAFASNSYLHLGPHPTTKRRNVTFFVVLRYLPVELERIPDQPANADPLTASTPSTRRIPIPPAPICTRPTHILPSPNSHDQWCCPRLPRLSSLSCLIRPNPSPPLLLSSTQPIAY